MMRALVVDDELPAREELALLLEETGAFEVVAKAPNAIEALAAIRRERPDVMFLDVQMPVVGGFELLSMIDDELLPEVVFVTAHDEFALKAFDESAADYLLKPVSAERLARTTARLRRRAGTGAGASRPAIAGAPLARIPCLGPRTIKLVPLVEIEYARSTLSGVHVVCAHGEYPTDLTLAVLEARGGMLRCHKQYLVNVEAVDEVSLGDEPAVRTRSGHSVPVSRRHLAPVRERLGL
jgi:two-component system, LytTR family, response regulator